MMKRIISLLLAACIVLGTVPALPFEASAAVSDIKPSGYHLVTSLPTAQNPKMTGLYFGGAVEADGALYGISSTASSNAFTTSSTTSRCGITIHYGGNDATYGNYYYLEFTLSSGVSYVLAYAGGYFTQNKLTDGLPSGGFAYKHRLYFDSTDLFFYHRPEADKTVMKGLKLSVESKKLFTETAANLKTASTAYVPARLYTACTSNGVAGSSATHTWTGSCTCGHKFNYQEKAAPEHYHVFTALPTAGATTAILYLGAPLDNEGVTTFYGMSSTASSNAFSTNSTFTAQNTIAVRYGGNDATYGDYYYLEFTLSSGVAYTLAYAGGHFTQNKLTDGLPSGGFAYKHRLYFDAEGQFFYHRPEADKTVMKGLKLSTESKKLFTETAANLKTESTAYVPARVYAPCESNGVAGANATHTWTGSCSCGYRFGLTEKAPIPTEKGFHLFTQMPTAENPATEAELYLGATLNNQLYSLNNTASGNAFTTTSDESAMCKITVRYGGNDATYGDYYYLVFTFPSGVSYTLAYAGGYFTQNKLTDGQPSGGFAYKHRLYYDDADLFFYHRPDADKTVMKGLKFSVESQKLFVETAANLKTENAAYVPARLFARCTADSPAGNNQTHHWDGVCSCGYQLGYSQHQNPEQLDWNVKNIDGHSKVCSCGYVLVALTAHNVPSQDQWEEDPIYGIKSAVCGDCGYRVYEDHDHVGAWQKDDDHHWKVCGACGVAMEGEAHHTFGQWTTVTKPTTLQDRGSEERSCTACGFVQTQETSLQAEDFTAIENPPSFNVPFYLGATQKQMEGTPTYFFKGSWAPSKYLNMDTTTDMYGAKAMYAEAATGGYKLYFFNGEVKTYLMIDYMTVDESTGVFVQPTTDAETASVFKWNNQYATFQTNVPEKGDYYIGLYTDDKDVKYTKLQPLLTSGLDRDDRHPAKVYTNTVSDHVHTFGEWEVLSVPTTLQEQGMEKRICAVCGGEEVRVINLSAEDFQPTTNPPTANAPFYLGATQKQIEGTPTYFFKGAWAAPKHLNMDTTTDMYSAKAMYAEEAEGGYKLYFFNGDVKTYLMIDYMTVGESTGVFVQPTTDEAKASVFKWNTRFETFQTYVEGRGDYYIGLYTDDKDVKYTKLQPLLTSGLGRDDRHPAKVYTNTVSDHVHTFSEWEVLSVPTTLQEQGKEKRTCSICGGEEVRITTLKAEDFQPTTNPPAANAPFYLGATQKQMEGTPTYFFKGSWAPSKYLNMDATTDMYSAKAMYAEEAEGGYKLYFFNGDVKTYLMIDYMTVGESTGVFVQPTTDEAKASVFKWNTRFETFQTYVEGRGDYYIGLYTDKGVNYTKLQPLLTSGLGRDDRHPAKVYTNTVSDHVHTFSEWEVLSVPTTLQEQGKEKRTCSICGGEEIRITTLKAEDFQPTTNPPAANVPFYLGATQKQIEGTPTYFFKGSWAPSKYLNMDATTDMYAAKAMYAEESGTGFKLYFFNGDVKTYLMIDYMTVGESTGVFVQPTTDEAKASVFKWNTRFETFQTYVEDRGDYYIGLYTDKGVNYTKLQPLLVSGLGREDRHASKIYMNTVFDHEHSFSDWKVLSVPTTLQNQGKEKRTCSVCGYEEIHITSLSTADFVASSNPPATNVPFYLGTTQRQVENRPTYFFKGSWAPSTYVNMDVSTDMETAAAMYAEAVDGGYKLYFYDGDAKTYLVLDEMTLNKTKGVYVQPTTNEKKATVFMWNEEFETFYTYVAARDDYYYIGLYTHNNIKYTKMQALLVSGLGRDDRHPSKVYLRTYETENHKHTFGKWETKSNPTHLNNQGVQERACTGCDYVQGHVFMLDESAYAPAKKAPKPGTGFYLGATQTQMEEQDTYFFMGTWLPRKFQRMEVSAEMKKGALMFTQAVEGGYLLYFYNAGVKTYLMIAEMRVEGDKGVFVQPTTEKEKASVFTWNTDYGTFQTEVEGKGAFCIGNYTIADIKYTKLSALAVNTLTSADYHAAVPYVSQYVHYDTPKTGDTTPVLLLVTMMVMSATALVVLVIGKKKLSLTEEK